LKNKVRVYKIIFEFLFRGGWKNWTPTWMCGKGIKNSVVGIIGCGNIGTSIAKKLVTFEISQLLYTSRSEKPAGKMLLLNTVNVIL
jgi:lactate dehydrogenase-like 2-hydroxyacid dehydrogenase